MLATSFRGTHPRRMLRALSSSAYADLRNTRAADVNKLAEVQQRNAFESRLRSGNFTPTLSQAALHATPPSSLTSEQCRTLLLAGFSSFHLHVESRISSLLGKGFYTIGPCGEEMTAAFGMHLDPAGDPCALHYRHLPAQLARTLKDRGVDAIDQILLDRARGYTCSSLDPVAGGAHSALGNGPLDYYVTSTLASQGPPAVGRALGGSLASHILTPDEQVFRPDMVSFVSVGDGSVNNSMFLAALNMADYAQHRSFKCPILFAVTNNDMCISLRGYGWLDKFLSKQRMPVFKADGTDMMDTWQATEQALKAVRTSRRPGLLVLNNIPRRFGHAATDRQNAYLSEQEISNQMEVSPLDNACAAALASGLVTSEELLELWDPLQSKVEHAFEVASDEPKLVERQPLVDRLSAPLAPVTSDKTSTSGGSIKKSMVASSTTHGSYKKTGETTKIPEVKKKVKKVRKDVMRKHMTRVLDEAMDTRSNCVYLGEDVRHGGYYLVSDGLAKKYPLRVIDFPPDETSLVGAGIGFAQAGLLPIVEIPYAKYLDCAADIFFEACSLYWLTNGRQPNGMVIRLQGFDRGVFGGNYHTHNSLHLPPGLDVICYSNASDYVRGMRHALYQASVGRVVMLVDSTDLLNRRHLDVSAKDEAWMSHYPALKTDVVNSHNTEDMLTFDTIIKYMPNASKMETNEDGPVGWQREELSNAAQCDKHQLVVVTYGNGLPLALQALKQCKEFENVDLVVVDCPNLTPNSEPEALKALVSNADSVLFADVCKQGQNPHSAMVTSLQASGHLANNWLSVAAVPTYNPLAQLTTFLSEEDVVNGCKRLLARSATKLD